MFKCFKCGGSDQNSDGNCARPECQRADLHAGLQQLITDWRGLANQLCAAKLEKRSHSPEQMAQLHACADQLQAVLERAKEGV